VIQRHLDQGNPDKAHEYVRNQILAGQPPPQIIARFFPRRRARGLYRGVMPVSYTSSTAPTSSLDNFSSIRRIVDGCSTIGGAEPATSILREQLYFLKTHQTRAFGFEVEALHESLYHWVVKFFQFDPESQLGSDLIQHHAIHSNQAMFHDYGTSPKKQTPVHIELKFSHGYPDHPPSLRVVQPHFEQDIEQFLSDSLSSLSHQAHTKSAPMAIGGARTTTTTTTTSTEEQTNGNGDENGDEATEEFGTFVSWVEKQTMGIVILHLRQKLIRYANGLEIDKPLKVKIEEPAKGFVTVDGFWNKYQPVPPEEYGKTDIERGGKIILPSSALAEISTKWIHILLIIIGQIFPKDLAFRVEGLQKDH